MENTLPAYAVGSGSRFGAFYTGDWEYLHLRAEASSAVAAAMFVTVVWYLNENPGMQSYQVDELTCWVRNPEGGFGEWCIPVRGTYCYIQVSSVAGVPAYLLSARLSNVYAPHAGNDMIMRTTPGSTGAISDTYAPYSTMGKARLSGYCFNSGVGTFCIVALQQLETTTGVWNTVVYFQTPAGALANTVHNFDIEVPLSGKALRIRENTGGGGANNSLVWLTPYPHGY